MIGLLLRPGGDLHAKAADGETACDIAAKNDNVCGCPHSHPLEPKASKLTIARFWKKKTRGLPIMMRLFGAVAVAAFLAFFVYPIA